MTEKETFDAVMKKVLSVSQFFWTSFAMRRVSSCDQVGPGAGSWAVTAGAARLKMSKDRQSATSQTL